MDGRKEGWHLTFQNGSTPVGRMLGNAFSTLHVSTIMKIIDRHIAASMIPNRGLTTTSSHNPKLYSRLIVQNRLAVVKTHHGSLYRCQGEMDSEMKQ
jgi:hypothetical protein